MVNTSVVPIKFNNIKMGQLYTEFDSGFNGMIFISKMFKKMTFQCVNTVKDGYSGNGWMVSAPCDNRKAAVEITNSLVRKLSTGLIVK